MYLVELFANTHKSLSLPLFTALPSFLLFRMKQYKFSRQMHLKNKPQVNVREVFLLSQAFYFLFSFLFACFFLLGPEGFLRKTMRKFKSHLGVYMLDYDCICSVWNNEWSFVKWREREQREKYFLRCSKPDPKKLCGGIYSKIYLKLNNCLWKYQIFGHKYWKQIDTSKSLNLILMY